MMSAFNESSGQIAMDLLCAAFLILALIPLGAKLLLLSARGAYKPPLLPQSGVRRPFFSIHVATHDEPPGMVIESLETLRTIDYPAGLFEVIVIDNNTPDPEIWEPVAEWCEEIGGGNFRFLHRENVRGAKAGALNIALEETSRKADHIVTVDADYQIYPGFLKRSALLLQDEGVSHIQFPQAYRGGGAALAAEYGQYFNAYGRAASRTSSMLLTGTMSVIRKNALERAGGWPVDSITEDARLGAELLAGGGNGIYIDEVQGTGLLPGSLSCLSKQRLRWTEGNANALRCLSPGRSIPGRHRTAVIGQLCAWLQGACFLVPVMLAADLVPALAPWKVFSVGAFLVLVLSEGILAAATARGSLITRIKAGAIRFAMSFEGAVGFKGLTDFHKPVFVRTLKTPTPRSCRETGGWPGLLVPSYILIIAVREELIATGILAVVFIVRAGARIWVGRMLSRPEKARAAAGSGSFEVSPSGSFSES